MYIYYAFYFIYMLFISNISLIHIIFSLLLQVSKTGWIFVLSSIGKMLDKFLSYFRNCEIFRGIILP